MAFNGSENGQTGLTLTVLGCGTMGKAILTGILSSLAEMKSSPPGTSTSGSSTPAEEWPSRLPSRFIACVRRPETVKNLRKTFAAYESAVTILQNENLRGVKEADIVLLCCKPQLVSTILGEIEESSKNLFGKSLLQKKLLISICAGTTAAQIEEILYAPFSDRKDQKLEERCRVVRAMPNTASSIRESMTVIATPNTPLPPWMSSITTWIFNRIGRVVYLPPSVMDASTALCGAGVAFYALVLEAMADGGVAMGLPREEAQLMAAQTMRGASGLVLAGEHPAYVREKVATPGGCTIGGLLVLEEGTVRGTVARAVREATVVASQLGKGVEGVNGTRF
ncbi:MAG: delta 1-pyrroline-5-carboxylate reductase [Peltula sp. TS41687]|nr:MAG: delta 1-pyrroline-5-carboxylate reductase [Peltula sp. TS41687]